MLISLFTTAVVETENAMPQTSEGSFMGLILYLLVVGVILYFLIFRPNKKRTESLIKLQNEIKIGDKITTIGGIIGTVKIIEKTTVFIEVSKDATIEILKSAIIENITQKAKI